MKNIKNLLKKKLLKNCLTKQEAEEKHCTAQTMNLSIKDFFSKCDQIRMKLQIWSHLLKKSLMENFIFCAMLRKEEENLKMRKTQTTIINIILLFLFCMENFIFC